MQAVVGHEQHAADVEADGVDVGEAERQAGGPAVQVRSLGGHRPPGSSAARPRRPTGPRTWTGSRATIGRR